MTNENQLTNRRDDSLHSSDSPSHVISVLLADDQDLIRAGFAMVINSQSDMHVIGQASDGAQAVELVKKLHPDVVLMDVRMPGENGISATGRIAQWDAHENASSPTARAHRTRVIILTTFDLDEYVMSAIHEGASGFLLKDTTPEEMLASIRTVYAGNAIIAPSATRRLISHLATAQPASHDQLNRLETSAQHDSNSSHATNASQEATAHHKNPDPRLKSLTTREREVLIEVAHGLSNQEIAQKLVISLPTVKTHVAHILAKTCSRDRVQAVVFAYENGLVH